VADELIVVEASSRVPCGTFQVIRYEWSEPLSSVIKLEDGYFLDLCLTPRPRARGRFVERWAPGRFENIGDIFLVPPGIPLHGCCDRGEQASVNCKLDSGFLESWIGEDHRWDEARLAGSLNIRSVAVRSVLVRLAEELRSPGFAAEVLIEAISMQLAVELARYLRETPLQYSGGGLAPWQLRRIDERLREKLEAPGLQELADLCRISTRHLARAFKASRGITIGEHVSDVRIENAKTLLRDRSIKEVASDLGFSSPSAFSVAFRGAVGVSPREYRLNLPAFA
jgi:AraC family transcriptional regulator